MVVGDGVGDFCQRKLGVEASNVNKHDGRLMNCRRRVCSQYGGRRSGCRDAETRHCRPSTHRRLQVPQMGRCKYNLSSSDEVNLRSYAYLCLQFAKVISRFLKLSLLVCMFDFWMFLFDVACQAEEMPPYLHLHTAWLAVLVISYLQCDFQWARRVSRIKLQNSLIFIKFWCKSFELKVECPLGRLFTCLELNFRVHYEI